MRKSEQRISRRWFRILVVTLACASPIASMADDWDMAMQQALRLDANGYTFLAIQQLEALSESYPDILRLKLELAALYLKVDQPDTAERYITEVLEDPNLPVKVRINAQMLQLNIQTAQTESHRQALTTLALTGGYEADRADSFVQLSAAARLTQAMSTLDFGGRPVPTQAIFNVAGLVKQEFDPEDRPGLINLEAGLAAGGDRMRLSGGMGYQVSTDVDGPLLFLDNRWRARDWTWTLGNHWLYHGDGWNQSHRLSVQKNVSQRWRIQGFGRYRWLTDNGRDRDQRELGLGQTLVWQKWRWQTDIDYDLDGEIWAVETGLDFRLNERWRLGTAIGTEDLGNTADNWYSEVSVRWTH